MDSPTPVPAWYATLRDVADDDGALQAVKDAAVEAITAYGSLRADRRELHTEMARRDIAARTREAAVRPVLDAARDLAAAADRLLRHCAYVNGQKMAENLIQTWRINEDLFGPLTAYRAAVGGSAEASGEASRDDLSEAVRRVLVGQALAEADDEWPPGIEDGLRAFEAEPGVGQPAGDTTQPAEPELVARCEGYDELRDRPCPGHLRFRWGMSDAPCDTCGGRCGVAVAKWERVAGVRALAEAGAPEPDADELLLVRRPGRMSGRATIGHSRLPLTTILEYLRAGDSIDLVVAAYPSLTIEQARVVAALRDELDAPDDDEEAGAPAQPDDEPGRLIGRTGEWWQGYSAGCDAAHAIGCTAVEAERDQLRQDVAAARAATEQRVADLQAEFRKADAARDRQLSTLRRSVVAVRALTRHRFVLEAGGRRSVDVDEVLAALAGAAAPQPPETTS